MFTYFPSQAQQIPNANFDSVYIGGIDRIFQWITSDGFSISGGIRGDTILPFLKDTSLQTTGFQFSEMLTTVGVAYLNPFQNNSIKLTSPDGWITNDGQPFPSFIINGEYLVTDSLGYPDFGRCASPFASRPDSLKGYYIFSDSLSPVDNWGKATLLLTKYDTLNQSRDTIAYLNSTLDLNPVDVWTPFAIPIPYWDGAVPDSMSLYFEASAIPGGFGVLWLDELSFAYSKVTSSELVFQRELLFYPNPAKEFIYLQHPLQTGQHILLRDLSGRIVLTLQDGYIIDVVNLPQGGYILEVWDEKRRISRAPFWKE